jgi:hypothetical protein
MCNRCRDDQCARILQDLFDLIGGDARRVERHREELPAFGRRLELEVNGELCGLQICGDTRQRLDVSSTLLGHLAPHRHILDRRRYGFNRASAWRRRSGLATGQRDYEQPNAQTSIHQRTKTSSIAVDVAVGALSCK